MDHAKQHLHEYLRYVRDALLAKLDGLSEYDIRRPMTPTGTNLLGLVKHLSTTEGKYFGEVFGRAFPRRLPRWEDETERRADMWASEDETRADIIDRYRRACDHADATIDALGIDAPGHVPWWPQPGVTLFTILVHVLAETSRHAGHADILREQLDGATGVDAESMAQPKPDAAYWQSRYAQIEQAARAADPAKA
jgi:uncharacterized damage-inducible protein DinB